MNKFSFLLLLILLTYNSYAQDTKFDSIRATTVILPNDSVKVNSLIEMGITISSSDPKEALNVFNEAINIAEKINFVRGLARAHHQAGNVHYFSTDYVMALEEWKAAEFHYAELEDLAGVANMLSNSGSVYYDQDEPNKALELYLNALSIAEKIGDKKRIATVQLNIGSMHLRRKEFDFALDAYLNALFVFKELNNSEGIGLALSNAGAVYTNKDMNEKALEMYLTALEHLRSTSYLADGLRNIGDINIRIGNFDKGLVYLDSAYMEATKAGNVREVASALNSLGVAYQKNGDIDRAIVFCELAKTQALQINKSNAYLESAANILVKLYSSKNNYRKAFENQQLLQTVRDSIYNMETNKKFNSLMFGFELDKKESEIKLLSKEQELQKKEVERQKGIRNGIAGGFLIVCLFAVTVFVQRNKIKAGKRQSDELLLNILPAETAKELKEKGHAEAQLIEQVTVLFTDFKGFIAMSEQLSPKELVNDLHACFSAFDRICEKYGIEKIKTIGDAYMAAGGLPSPNNTHAQDVVKAALEMAEVVENGKAAKIAGNLPYFDIRVGIHTGPVVAGIVGIKKFQYDIWGDTVNTASRMESNGAVGKVNISQATHELLKDDPQFAFTNRGKIEAKGKGKIDMYFVLKA